MATTLLFVHGTGVRREAFDATIEIVRGEVAAEMSYEVAAWARLIEDPFFELRLIIDMPRRHCAGSCDACFTRRGEQTGQPFLDATMTLLERRLLPLGRLRTRAAAATSPDFDDLVSMDASRQRKMSSATR